LQEENAGISPKYKKEMLEYLGESKPKFIIVTSNVNTIKDFLQEYCLYYSYLNLEIYMYIDS
jgi:cytochrome oxidase Cu insertion factor (SCO1/SenC/PrrC family)